MTRVHNFNAGPAALPLAVLERAQAELIDFEGTGMSILEHSHRGKAYDAVHHEAVALLRSLLAVPEGYDVLFLQGGASLQFAMVPMNLRPAGRSADYVVTGSWAKKALSEAKRLGEARVASAAEPGGRFTTIPGADALDLRPDAAYVHITTNNTIAGTQWHELPDTGGVPLVADMSSDFLWSPTDVSRFGLLYAGAQKNIGPSGVTVVVAKRSWIDQAPETLPDILSYRVHAANDSLFHTPNTFGVYMIRNVLLHLQAEGGLAGARARNLDKGALLYAAIDEAADFYRCPIPEGSRSYMNVVFRLPSEELEKRFLAKAEERHMVGLKGHRSVGGIRASIYNAVPRASVEALVDFMKDFRKTA